MRATGYSKNGRNYAKFDVLASEHPKVVSLVPRIKWAWFEAICYCQRNLTDGFIPAAAVRKNGWGGAVGPLLLAGLWEQGEDGYIVHDYLDWNDSRAEVEARIDKSRAAADARWNPSSNAPSNADGNALLYSALDGEPKSGSPGKRALIFEAIAVACEWDLTHLTATARKRANAAAKELADVEPGLILGFALQWREHYPGATITPQAITGNWTDYMAGKLAEPARGRR